MGWFSTHWRVEGISITSQRPLQQGSSETHPVFPNRHWLAAADPFLDDVNMTIFKYIATNVVESVETIQIISLLMTVALSRMSPITLPFIWREGGVDNLEYSSNWNSTELADRQGFSHTIPQRFYKYGYGYGTNGLAVRVSLAILIIYCAVAIAHIIYSITTGISSTAWDSASEVVALSMNSRPATELQNTCAGIQTTRVFEHKVRIASTMGTQDHVQVAEGEIAWEKTGSHLELLFPSQDAHIVSKVKVDREYGALRLRAFDGKRDGSEK